MAGILIEIQQKVFNYLNAIDQKKIGESQLEEMILFLSEELNIEISSDFNIFTFENKITKSKNF